MYSGYQKMLAMPAETENSFQSEEIEKNEIKVSSPKKKLNSIIDKLTRIMKMFLKLANIKGYDLIGRVRDSKGNFIKDSDIIALINHSLTHGKLLLGQNEFIHLLFEANIEPELIINENIKSKLTNLYSNKTEDSNENLSVPTVIDENKDESTPTVENSKPIKKAKKRKVADLNGELQNREIEEEKNSGNKKRKLSWEKIDSEDENWEMNE